MNDNRTAIATAAAFENRTRRWREQRWLVDAMIHLGGPEFDQPRSMIYSAPAGFEALGDFQAANARIKKFADMHREYAAAARRREAKADEFARQGRLVAARESWFIAAQLWACARWPRFSVDALHIEYSARLTHCYASWARLASHRVEQVEIPFEGDSLPGWLHWPRDAAPGHNVPLVIYLPGMDNNKEQMVAMYGDKMLERGVAVLAIDGPGQAECIGRGIHVTQDNHEAAARATKAWLAGKPGLQTDRIGVRGLSFGSYFALQWAIGLGDACAGAVAAYVAHEPGLGTLFEAASPTFKVRFMMMAGIDDEAEFDAAAKRYDPLQWADRISAPVLIQAGEDDELSPLEHTEALFDRIAAPKCLVVYEGHKHVLRGPGSVAAGENPDTMFADWLVGRLGGEPMRSERVFVAMGGQTTRSAVE